MPAAGSLWLVAQFPAPLNGMPVGLCLRSHLHKCGCLRSAHSFG